MPYGHEKNCMKRFFSLYTGMNECDKHKVIMCLVTDLADHRLIKLVLPFLYACILSEKKIRDTDFKSLLRSYFYNSIFLEVKYDR